MIRKIWQYWALVLKPSTFSPFLSQSSFLLPSELVGVVKTEKHHEARGCSFDPMKPQEYPALPVSQARIRMECHRGLRKKNRPA